MGGESAELTGKVVRDLFYRKLGVVVRSTDRGNRHRTVIVKFTKKTVKVINLKRIRITI